jgi:allantoate deiminase
MRDVHRLLDDWMQSLGMDVTVDAIGNLRGVYPGSAQNSERRLLIGSHLDTVPNAGAFDGVLGVVLAIALVEVLDGVRLPFAIEIIGFSEEEGVRFGIPFLGNRALVGRVDDALLQTSDKDGISVAEAIRRFGLDPCEMRNALAHPGAFAYLEFHIEQGPLLEHLRQPLGVVQAIAGQSRYAIAFAGANNHAGTTPMHLRRDALAGAAEWVSAVESTANSTAGLVATVAAMQSEPRAGNVIPGLVTASLDIRHASDEIRKTTAATLLSRGAEIAARRNLQFRAESRLDQPAAVMDAALISAAQRAAQRAGCDAPLMTSGAGHDAMILAEKIPSVMLFLRSPGGISHHPDESVLGGDVELALSAGVHFVTGLATE